MSGSVSASTLAYTAIGTSLLGAGVSAAGMASQSQAQAAQANYQSQVARNNQTLAERQAAVDQQQGDAAAQTQAMKTLQTEGAQKAALASQGGDIDTGSDAGIIGDTAMAGKFDLDTVRYDTALKIYGDDIAGEGFGASASADSAAAVNDTAAAPLGIGASLLGGASSAAGKWYGYMTGQSPGGIPNNGGLSGTGGIY